MDVYVYDPAFPPPEVIGITLSEYDRIKADISKLYDYHNFIRKTARFIRDGVLDESELEDLRMDLDHFEREYFNVPPIPQL